MPEVRDRLAPVREYLRSEGADEQQVAGFLRHHGAAAPGAERRIDPDALRRAAEAYVDAGFYLHRPSIRSFARLVSAGAPRAVLVGALAGFVRHFIPAQSGPLPDPAADLRDLDEPHLRTVCVRFLEWWHSHADRIKWDRTAHRFRLNDGPTGGTSLN
jgi:hypothetical protein